MPGYALIDHEQLQKKLDDAAPENEDERRGYALVNVLPPEAFAREHIPGSINVAQGHEDELERRFDKEKEIIVYCASPECDASEKAAKALARRGFRRIVDYEAGMSEWRRAGHAVAGSAS